MPGVFIYDAVRKLAKEPMTPLHGATILFDTGDGNGFEVKLKGKVIEVRAVATGSETFLLVKPQCANVIEVLTME